MKLFPSIVAVLLFPAAAQANPHALPFTYPYATLPKSGIEVEQYVDLTPVPTLDAAGASQKTPRAIVTTEIEYGILDRLELGLYVQLSNDPGSDAGSTPLRFDGIKQRLRLRLAEAGAWPVDVGLYGEIAELSNEFEVEGKIILERRLGRVQLITNLWAEYGLYYAGESEWVLNPTAGVTVEIAPVIHLGVEYWMHGEFDEDAPSESFNSSLHHFVGPTALLEWDKLWWSAGVYLRMENWGREAQLGDEFGRVWIRSMVGLGW